MNLYQFTLGNQLTAEKCNMEDDPNGENHYMPHYRSPWFSQGMVIASDTAALAVRKRSTLFEAQKESEVSAPGCKVQLGNKNNNGANAAAAHLMSIDDELFTSDFVAEAIIGGINHVAIRLDNQLCIDPFYFRHAFSKDTETSIYIEADKNRVAVMQGEYRALIMKFNWDQVSEYGSVWSVKQ